MFVGQNSGPQFDSRVYVDTHVAHVCVYGGGCTCMAQACMDVGACVCTCVAHVCMDVGVCAHVCIVCAHLLGPGGSHLCLGTSQALQPSFFVCSVVLFQRLQDSGSFLKETLSLWK